MPKIFVITGVSGCGKSLIGQQLAQALSGVFEDADDFHSAANKAKMANKIPLTDSDRWPWLDTLRQRITLHQKNDTTYVLACSALKQSYRDRLRAEDPPESLMFVYLKGTPELILQRMGSRDHFMPPELLDSQFTTLEEPQDALVLDIQATPEAIVNAILQSLG